MVSDETFSEGLFVFDTNRIPYGCGAWPAFWTSGPSWPAGGEIDVIEHVHNSRHTDHTLHTSSGCDYSSVSTSGQITGTWGSSKNCNAGNAQTGCGIRAADGTHGEPWTNGGGGVHVMLWDRSKGIMSTLLVNLYAYFVSFLYRKLNHLNLKTVFVEIVSVIFCENVE